MEKGVSRNKKWNPPVPSNALYRGSSVFIYPDQDCRPWKIFLVLKKELARSYIFINVVFKFLLYFFQGFTLLLVSSYFTYTSVTIYGHALSRWPYVKTDTLLELTLCIYASLIFTNLYLIYNWMIAQLHECLIITILKCILTVSFVTRPKNRATL